MATNFTQNSIQQTASILKKISYATGIDNPTKSSKVGQIVEAIKTEIADYSGFITEKINDMRYTTASERALDLIGAGEGVFRNTRQYIDILASHSVIKIKLSNGDYFDKVRNVSPYIESGTTFQMSQELQIQLLDEVRLNPGEKEVYVSARLYVQQDGGGVSISKGKQMILPLQYNEYANSNEALVFEFDQPVRFDITNNDDDFFRSRIGAKKTDPLRTSGSSLEIAIREVAGVSGVYIKANMRGPGTIDIGFVSNAMLLGEQTDSDKGYMKSAIEQAIQRNYAYSAQVKVLIPAACVIMFDYQNESTVADDVVQDAIIKAFNSAYLYSEYNGFLVQDIEDRVKRSLRIEDFEIVQASLYDPNIDYVISISSQEIIAPINVYMITNSTSLRKVV